VDENASKLAALKYAEASPATPARTDTGAPYQLLVTV
jgi:hypothetical protein